MPKAISANPRTTRSHDAQVGGVWCRPPSRSEAPTNAAVRATRPSTQPPRKARPAGRGRGACRTSTAGMTVIGESAMTSPSGTSLVSTEPQFSATGSNHRTPLAFPPQRPGRHPVRDRSPLGAVHDRVRHQPPPVALLADAPAAQPALDDLVQLQTVGLIPPRAVRFARKEHRQVNQHRDRRTAHPKRAPHGLAVVSDRGEVAHLSIIRSNRKPVSPSAYTAVEERGAHPLKGVPGEW